MLARLCGSAVIILLTCGFQVSGLRWRVPAVMTLRFIDAGMPEDMRASAASAAQLWRSPSLEIRIVNETYEGKVNGTIRYGGPLALDHGIMGTMLRMGKESRQLTGCDIEVSDGPIPWHMGIELPGSEQSDTITAFAHELGRCMGLLHEDNATTPALMRTAIYYGEYHRTLPPDDAAARNMLFPAQRRSSGCSLR